jgi:hypothetical protein
LSKVVAYTGENPWTGGNTDLVDIDVGNASFPWARMQPTESWVAMVDPETDVGLGLYSPIGTTIWNVGATGNPPGGPTSSATMHMAPVRVMELDRDSILVYRYWLIHGDLNTIRSRVYELRNRYPDG